jgi:hypothetical protein
MYIRCYESTADMVTQETLWLAVRKSGWMSNTGILGINRYYIPESLEFWAVLVDSSLRRIPSLDYIA